jgi:small subunit ribosomal protein S8
MAMTDPIADYLTRIRNAQTAGHRIVEIPLSKMKARITEILYDQGYIHKYKVVKEGAVKEHKIMIALKYDPLTKEPVIRKLKRVSTPGLRTYVGVSNLPRVINGLGIAVVSTPKGVMVAKKARQENVGGEVLCYVY